jgi:hypothetical protein
VRRARPRPPAVPPNRVCAAATVPAVPCLGLPQIIRHRDNDGDDRQLQVVQLPTPAFPTFTNPPTPPTTTSELSHFLQTPAQRSRSKSLSVDRLG